MFEIRLRKNEMHMIIYAESENTKTHVYVFGSYNSGESIIPNECTLCNEILHSKITSDTIFEDFFKLLDISDYESLRNKSVSDYEPEGYYDAEDEYYPPRDVICIPLDKYPDVKIYSYIDDFSYDGCGISLRNPEFIKILRSTDFGKILPVVWENVNHIDIFKEYICY